MLKKKNGFTLLEILIVVAVIAVLVVVAITVVSSSLEKSREASDIANIRSAYSKVLMNTMLTDVEDDSITVNLGQKADNWQKSDLEAKLNSLGIVEGTPVAEGTCKVEWDAEQQKVKFIFEGEGGNSPGRYDFGNSRKSRLTTMAKAFADLFETLDENILTTFMDWRIGHEPNYNFNGTVVDLKYRELWLDSSHIDDLNNSSRNYYWENGKQVYYKIGELLNKNGVDYSAFSDPDYVGSSAILYFDPDTRKPIAISYYASGNSGSYRITYLDNGSTYETPGTPYRQYFVYNRDYTENNLTPVND